MGMGVAGAGTAAGLVIRGREVQLLVMKGKTVTARVRVPIAGDEPGHLVEALRNAVEEGGVVGKRVAVSLPSQDVLFRFFTIPPVPKQECDAVVQFEARKYIPFKTELLIWDYRAVPALDAKRLEVIFAAVPRDVFRAVQDALLAAGVQAALIEPRSVSLARLLPAPKGAAATEYTCLVDVEADAAHLAIVKNRLPYLTRDIDFVPAPDAAGAAAAPPAAELAGSEDVDPRAQRLLSELSVSMDFFLREHPSTVISRVLLCGDESLIGPWCRWLSDQLHRPVLLGQDLLYGRVDGELPLSFASAVGLVRAVIEPGSGLLDFLKRSQVKSAGSAKTTASHPVTLVDALAWLRSPQAVAGACALGGLLVAGWLGGAALVQQERQRLQLLQRMPAANPRWGLDAMPAADLEALKRKLDAQLAALARLLDRRVQVTPKLDALARVLPQGLWLTGVEFADPLSPATQSDAHVTVKGACYLGDPRQELGAIQTFELALKQHQVFAKGCSTIQLEHMRAEEDQARHVSYRVFEVSCQSNRPL